MQPLEIFFANVNRVRLVQQDFVVGKVAPDAADGVERQGRHDDQRFHPSLFQQRHLAGGFQVLELRYALQKVKDAADDVGEDDGRVATRRVTVAGLILFGVFVDLVGSPAEVDQDVDLFGLVGIQHETG